MNYNKYLFTDKYKAENHYFSVKLSNILPNPDEILRKTGNTVQAYRELKNDAHLWSCIQSRKSGVLALEHRIMQNEAGSEIFEFVRNIINQMDIQSLIRDILEAPLFGYQPLEIVWDFDYASGTRVVPKEIIPKQQELFCFDNDGHLMFVQDCVTKPTAPEDYKILDVRSEPSRINPYGHSLLAKCYWSVVFKKAAMKYWVNFSERYGIPILVGQYTRGSTADEAKELADLLSTMTEDSVIVTPSDINISFEEANKNSSSDLFKELIKHCNAEISKAILSQTLTTELDMGSYAASQTHYKVRKEVILSDARLVEQSINTLIKYIVELNYGKQKSPQFNLIINDSDNQWRVDRDAKLVSETNIRFTKKYWEQNYGFAPDDFFLDKNGD